MAEFLIFNKDSWMDKIDSQQWQELMKEPKFAQKYLARYQRGDIIEVRPNGFFTGKRARGFNKKAFRLLVVPGLKPEYRYMEPSPNHSSRYRINLPGDEIIVTISADKFKPEDKGD